MICRELNKEFSDQEEMFAALKANLEDIIALKKAQIQKSCDKGSGLICKSLDPLKLTEEIKNLPIDDDYYYIATNATKILDQHGDLHVDGIWKKTIKDQQGKVYLVADHKLELDKVIARKADVEILTAEIPFSLIGKAYEGNTQALIYKVRKDKIIMPLVKEWLESGADIESSVRMRYVSIKFAVNSTDENYKEELKNYNEYFPQIANKADYEEIPYFWVITEAENVKESSLVLFGSNQATGPIVSQKEKQTQNEEIKIQDKRKKSII